MYNKSWNQNSIATFFPTLKNDLMHRGLGGDWRMNIAFPPVNVKEEDADYKVIMAIPGMKREDIHLEVKDNELIVRAATKTKSTEETEEYTHQEFDFHSFKRSFHLPKNIEVNKIESKYVDGILTITIPRPVLKKNEKKVIPVGK